MFLSSKKLKNESVASVIIENRTKNHMEPDSFATLPGEYIGNVAGTPLNVGSLAKTGKIYIAIEGVNKLSISTQSVCTKELTVNVQLDELRKAYDQKQTVLLRSKINKFLNLFIGSSLFLI